MSPRFGLHNAESQLGRGASWRFKANKLAEVDSSSGGHEIESKTFAVLSSTLRNLRGYAVRHSGSRCQVSFATVHYFNWRALLPRKHTRPPTHSPSSTTCHLV